MIKIEIAEN
jgi:hypothetical protein